MHTDNIYFYMHRQLMWTIGRCMYLWKLSHTVHMTVGPLWFMGACV